MCIYHHDILPSQQLVCCSVRTKPLLLMWFPLGMCLPTCWEGDGARRDTWKSPCPGGSSSHCLSAWAHAQHREASQGCYWSCWPLACCAAKQAALHHFEMLLFPSITRMATASAAGPLSHGRRRRVPPACLLAPTLRDHKMAPCRAPGSQRGCRARGTSWAVGAGLTPAVLLSMLIFLRAGFSSASERPSDWKCWLKASQSLGYESLGLWEGWGRTGSAMAMVRAAWALL